MKHLIIFLLIFSCKTSYTQTIDNTSRQSNSNIYNDAIARFVDGFSKPEIKIADTIYIEMNELTDSLIRQSDETTIIILDTQSLTNYLEIHKYLLFYKVDPIQLNNGEFSISIEMLRVRSSERTKRKSFSRGETEAFAYRFENNHFTFLRKDILDF